MPPMVIAIAIATPLMTVTVPARMIASLGGGWQAECDGGGEENCDEFLHGKRPLEQTLGVARPTGRLSGPLLRLSTCQVHERRFGGSTTLHRIIESDIDCRRRLSDAPDRNEVDARLGDGTDCFQGNPA